MTDTIKYVIEPSFNNALIMNSPPVYLDRNKNTLAGIPDNNKMISNFSMILVNLELVCQESSHQATPHNLCFFV